MARNTTLGELIDDLRAEAGHSLQSNLGPAMRDVLIKILQRQQRRLWEENDWSFLRVKRDVLAQAGQRYYNIPSDMVLESIERVEFKWEDRWQTLDYGIGQVQYDQYDSDRDIRSWPIYRWEEAENNQVEVWPIPSNNADPLTNSGAIRFTGKRNLQPLVAESDQADLDDTLLVLYSAAEVLAREKAEDATLKLQMAERHLNRLRARTSKRSTFTLSGEEPRFELRGPAIIAVRNP
jgi:hypothetical protein